MSRKTIGTAIVLFAAITMIFNVSMLQSHDYYHTIRKITYALFIVGILLTPTYSKTVKTEG
ncbi:hypothetical protein [Jeotgalibacillus proteolyticus]|uniref:Uncharacterized protein n=1 Tax=Jeotgalibacillus proteolyticus TaxID=2082395 RepID=A0A2S5G905_9BACL|nr:hypothetical protein [Jeotgalibacillus proteolyticus]PPA69459.1 hypothetical protein C4B60_16920 [Jeotgalibacillus proteolyticus]